MAANFPKSKANAKRISDGIRQTLLKYSLSLKSLPSATVSEDQITILRDMHTKARKLIRFRNLAEDINDE